jgi:hypothetical protein
LNRHFLLLFLVVSVFTACAQPQSQNAAPQSNIALQPENFSLDITQLQNFSTAPGLQSFAFAQHDGKWLFLGGRTDGLHQRQPFASFLAADNNTNIFVVDPVNKQVWSSPLSSLGTTYQEQLQSTNINFKQVDTILYLVGGYGYSATAADHITYPYLTAVNVPMTINAIVNGGNISSGFRQVQDTAFQVTGGQLDYLDGTFYLVGGQKFIGRYNPQGPTHGPGFFQRYTEAIRKFQVTDNGSTLTFNNYQEIRDSANLHRRDYNMAPQFFSDGTKGFTVFSGVFQHTANLPWHNTVDVRPAGYTVRNTFEQLLSQYHSAKLPVYDSLGNAMHTLFFGGISRYYFNSSGVLMDDQNAPFVKTISKITRFSNDSMVEYSLAQQMPGFLGSGAEFIPLRSAPYYDEEILNINALPFGRTLVGHIYGGIESSAENIFFVNDGTQSWASNAIFEVYIQKDSTTAVRQEALDGENVLELKSFPNPTVDVLNIEYKVPYYAKHRLFITDSMGRTVNTVLDWTKAKGSFGKQISVKNLPNGLYFITLETEGFRRTEKFVVGQ